MLLQPLIDRIVSLFSSMEASSSKMNWNTEATNIIKAAKSRKGAEWKDISALLQEQLGVELSPQTLANRVNKGAFSFALALQILSVLEVKSVDIPKVETPK